ncbi:MAG: RagB/SusD family nutrient uptake outer membrane protein [Niabella sp.]
MRNYTYLYTILILIGSLASCKKGSFLKEDPYSFYDAGTVYETDAGAKSALIGLYSAVSDYDYFGAAYPCLTSQASGSFWSAHPASRDLTNLNVTSTTYWTYQVFDQSYTIINRANDIIAHLPNGKVSSPVSNDILGQAHWIRAMIYFNLVRIYGGVPLRTAPVTESDLYLPRSAASEVYNLVIEDLKKAWDLLPEPAAQQIGYPHKYAANALLGKVYVTLAGNDPSSSYWTQARDILKTVIDAEGTAYSLVPKYGDIWDITKENSKEAVFEVQFLAVGANNGQLTNIFMPKNIDIQPNAVAPSPFAWVRVNKEVYDRHAAQYPGDPRIGETFINTFRHINGTNVAVYPNNTAAQGFPYIRKYKDPNFISARSDRNLIYMRYADVLLLMAEAENEVNGPGNAYQYVNKVLARARNSAAPAATVPQDFSGMTKEQFRERIMSERYYELLGEFQEFFDVRRRGESYFLNYLTQHNSYSKLNPAYDFIYPVDAKLMLMPIPFNEINNNPEINEADQNPGY